LGISLELGVLVAALHSLFATANAIFGALATAKTKLRMARTSILLVFQRHLAGFALVKLLLFVSKHIFS